MSSGVAVYEAINNGDNFVFKEFNLSGEGIDNVKKEDIIGKTVLEAFPGVKDFGLYEVFQRVWKTGKPEHHPITFYKDNRFEGWRENYVYKLPSGEIVAVYDDITDRMKAEKKLKESEEKYRLITENANDIISVFDENFKLQYINEVQQKISGFTKEEVMGKSPTEFIHPDDIKEIIKLFKKALKIGTGNGEFRIRRRDGSYIWLEASGKRIYDKNKKSKLIIISRDISERKLMEQKLRGSENKYRDLYEEAPNAYFSISPDKSIIRCNKAAERLLGYSQEELLNMKIFNLYANTENGLQKAKRLFKRFLEGKQIKDEELQMKHKNGNPIWISLSVRPILDQTGNVIESRSMVIDITDRKKAEKALKESEERYRILFDSSPVGIGISNFEGRIIEINKKLQDILGYSLDELKNLNVKSTYEDPNERKKILDILKKSGRLNNFDVKLKKKDGIIFSGLLNIEVLEMGNKKVFLSNIEDISERKKAEKQIADLAKFPSENPNPVLRVNENNILYINEAGRRLFNLTEGNKIPYILQDAINSVNDKTYSKEVEIKLNNRIYSFNMTPIQEEGYINIYGRNINERKRAEEKLKESEEKYRLISENANDLIVVLNQKYVIEYVNKASLNVLNFLSDEMIGKTPKDFVHPDDYDGAINALNKGFKEGEGKAELRLKNKNGHYIWFDIKGRIFIDKDGENKALIILRDVSERKESEEVLKESEKKYREAYNRASFYKELIAHDMNNVLQSIHSSVELHKLSKEKPDLFKDKKDFLSTITENVFRGSQIASNVIKLSEIEEIKMPLELVDVNKNLMDAIVFIHKIYQTRKLNINVETLKEDHFALANDLILDLFENILINSIKHNINPEIEIQTRISDIQLDNKKYCKIEFIDNGIGGPDERKETIFHRREKNGSSTKGMGIGLSLVKQIIDSFNGKIWVENRVKEDHTKGSNFIVLIPKTK